MEALGPFATAITILGLILFFSPIIIICRLGKISATLQEMNKKMEEKPINEKTKEESGQN